MEENTDTDSDFESAEEGSEYFSVTDGGDEMQFQQLDWDGDYVDYDKQSEDRSVGGSGDIPVGTLSDTNPSRRSNRIRIKKRKEDLPPVNTMCFERLKKSKVGKIKIYKRRTNSKHYSEFSTMHHHIHIKKKLICPTCSKSFLNVSKLEIHIRTHTGEKPYACLICYKSFNTSFDLKRHIRTHTGEKPFECPTCHNSFSQRSTLIFHIRTHTGEKPYKCLTCFKSFIASSGLKKHIRTHTGDKPFKCTTCSKSFSQLSTLKIHSTKIHCEEN